MRIRVDTEDLKTNSADFETASKAFHEAGEEILTVAMSMPDYDGQLSGPARAAGMEIQRKTKELQTSLANDHDALKKAASDFEAVDNQTIEVLSQNQAVVSDPTLSPTHPPQNGNAYLGYQDDGKSEYVILCIYGTCRKVKREGNEEEIEKFKQAVDDYYTNMQNAAEHAEKIIAMAGATLGGSILAGLATLEFGGVGALIVTLYGGLEMKAELDAERADQKLAHQNINDATYYWNVIFGDNLETDDDQSVWSFWTRNAQEIYEP